MPIIPITSAQCEHGFFVQTESSLMWGATSMWPQQKTSSTSAWKGQNWWHLTQLWIVEKWLNSGQRSRRSHLVCKTWPEELVVYFLFYLAISTVYITTFMELLTLLIAYATYGTYTYTTYITYNTICIFPPLAILILTLLTIHHN